MVCRTSLWFVTVHRDSINLVLESLKKWEEKGYHGNIPLTCFKSVLAPDSPRRERQRAYEQDLPPCATGVTLAWAPTNDILTRTRKFSFEILSKGLCHSLVPQHVGPMYPSWFHHPQSKLGASDRLETWLIPSGTNQSTQHHESTMVWRNLPPYHRF